MSAAEPCPKCGHQRQEGEPGAVGECPRCGVIHDKYRAHQARFAATTRLAASDDPAWPEPSSARQLWSAVWALPERDEPLQFYAELAVYALIVAWGLWFIFQPWDSEAIGESFLHRVNLPFHEFGHVLFRPFGQWLMFLGGSLFQCLLPLLPAGYFLFWQRQPFSAAVCLWWCGQNFIDLAPYIGDARAMALPLVGEWSDEVVSLRSLRHDWHNILEPLGWLPYDHRLALISKTIGSLIMLLAWSWGGALLLRRWHRLR